MSTPNEREKPVRGRASCLEGGGGQVVHKGPHLGRGLELGQLEQDGLALLRGAAVVKLGGLGILPQQLAEGYGRGQIGVHHITSF